MKNHSSPRLSAASGLVVKNNFLFMVADDELSLASLPLSSATKPETIQWLPLLVGDLPLDPHERKKSKADFESLVLCEPNKRYPLGGLLCFPSGSRSERRTGVLLAFKNQGNQFSAPQSFNLSPLYDMLFATLGLLNIEGALFLQDELILFHRANLKDPKNWAIHLNAEQFLQELFQAGKISAKSFLRIQEIKLGELSGIPLGVTDACRISATSVALLAAAEATGDPYSDAACAGSAICVLDLKLEVLRVVPLRACLKSQNSPDLMVFLNPNWRKVWHGSDIYLT